MRKFKATIQVKKEHYTSVLGSYIHLYNQVDDITKLIKKYKIIEPKILIIGVGDDLLKIMLKNKFGFVVKTMDIDPNLEPDYVSSVDNLQNKVLEKFNIVVCAHVLEHLPYKYFNNSLSQIKAISDYSLIYLPIAKFGLSLGIGIYPLFFKKMNFVPTWFFKKHKFDGQHYWEIGVRGYSLNKIRKELEKYFYIEKEYNPDNWLYSYNFILKSKK
jgi:hypothetical protein